MLEAKRLGHRAVLRLSWLLLVSSVALSTLLQVAVAHPPWSATSPPAPPRCGCWAASPCSACCIAPPPPPTRPPLPRTRSPAGESKRERARAAYAALVAAGQPRDRRPPLAEAAGVSASYGRALLADFAADPTLAGQANGQRPTVEVGER